MVECTNSNPETGGSNLGCVHGEFRKNTIMRLLLRIIETKAIEGTIVSEVLRGPKNLYIPFDMGSG